MSMSRKVRPIRKFEASAATFLASLARRWVAITPARPRLRPRLIRLAMAPSVALRASSDTSPAAAGANSWASSTTTRIGYQRSRSASNSPFRKAAAARIWESMSQRSRFSTAEVRCCRTRPAMRYRSSSERSPSTTMWPKRSARLTKSPSGSTTTCCTQAALCSSRRRSRCDLPEPELPCTSSRVASSSSRSIMADVPSDSVPMSIWTVIAPPRTPPGTAGPGMVYHDRPRVGQPDGAGQGRGGTQPARRSSTRRIRPFASAGARTLASLSK